MQWHLPAADTYFQPILEKTPEGFEIEHLKFALQYCRQFRLAIDVGAHIGTWTRYLSGKFERVIAFEAAPDTFECLAKNTVDLPNVQAFDTALGPCAGYCGVVDDPTRVGNTGSRQVSRDGWSVHMNMLDTYITKDLDFLKLDVEGYELEVLKGGARTILMMKPTIVMECKDFNPPRHGGPAIAKTFLTNLGYKEVGGVRNDRVFVPL